jgi:hypothetical protein
MKKLAGAVLGLALVLASPPAAARDVAGQAFADGLELGGQKLALNGAGIRKKLFIKVYAAGLYVTPASADADAVIAADAPKLVRMVFLRGVSRDQVLGAFREGFEKNSGGPALPELLRKLDELVPAIPADFKEGQELVVAYVPGEGATIRSAAGSVLVAGKPFADALFRNWLGASPADGDLKKGLLGK